VTTAPPPASPQPAKPTELTPAPLVITRRLSAEGRALVARGDWVEPGTPLLAMETFPGRVLRTQVARELRIDPDQTEDTVVPSPGTIIQQGDVLARSSLFWSHRIAHSQHEGSVAGVSPSLGVIYLREHIPTQVAETVQINVIEELSGDKNHFHSYVQVKDGDKIERGQVIATRNVGHNYQNIFSPVFGTVCNVAPLLGTLSIIPDQVASVVTAHIPGVVAAVRHNREVDVVGYGLIFDGLVGVGGEASGPLVVRPNATAPWRPGPEDEDLAGCILVTGAADNDSLAAAAALGVSGLVAGRARQADLCRFVGQDIGVIATGEEEVPLVLVLTEGFGQGAMTPRLHRMLAAVAGRTVSLSGTTHIRAGVIRPRLVVSVEPPTNLLELAGADTGLAGTAAIGLVEVPTELAAGLRARVLRGPHAGRSGIIKELIDTPRVLPTGAEALVARLEVDPGDDGPGEIVLAAQANLKLEGGETNHG